MPGEDPRVNVRDASVRPLSVNTTSMISLEAAMERFKLADDSRPLVRQMALRAGVTGCEVKKSYIKAFREDGLHPLHIGKTMTEWFASEVEAGSASDRPDAVRERTNGAGAANWGVEHATSSRSGAGADGGASRVPVRARNAEPRDYGVCETCWQARTPSGSCGCDD